MSIDYLKRILTSKVYDVAHETSLEVAPRISARIGNTVLLKREDTQPVFSFKLRGAYNKMANLSQAELKRGVIAARSEEHTSELQSLMRISYAVFCLKKKKHKKRHHKKEEIQRAKDEEKDIPQD